MMKEFAIVIAQMPAEILLVSESAVTLAALERAVFVVHHFDVALQVAAAGEARLAQVAGVRPLVCVRLQVGLQRVGLHDAVTRQAFDARSLAFAHHDRPHLDAAVAVFVVVFIVIRVLFF